MRWLESLPVRMQRVALVAPSATLREVLAEVADAAVMQIDRDSGPQRATSTASTDAGVTGLLTAGGRPRTSPAQPSRR